MPLNIQNLQGVQYPREGSVDEEKDSKYFSNQYATSSYKERDLRPGLIVRPRDDRDIIATINWAREKKCHIAVRSGGHQYSGASSTGGGNIQIDLSETYKDMKMLPRNEKTEQNRSWIQVGVSNRLGDLNAYLKDHGLFVPHGQCAHVGVGGHGQTGGYGQLARGFGLFGDQIVKIRMIDHAGNIRDITKESDSELFWAILGGSPGNFGIITHYVVSVFKADQFMEPHGIRGVWIYDKQTLQQLLQVLADFSDDEQKTQGLDLCVSVLSIDFDITKLIPGLKDPNNVKGVDENLKNQIQPGSDLQRALRGRTWPTLIVVYASWCPTKGEKYNTYPEVEKFFAKFRQLHNQYDALLSEEFNAEGTPKDKLMDMATMTGKWIFPQPREFELPYVKRTYATNSTQLGKSGWVNEVVERIDLICNPKYSQGKQEDVDRYRNCKLAVQIQAFGGVNSQFAANRNNGTSYSWRDSTIVQVLDCFHQDTKEGKDIAEAWQMQNDKLMKGPNSKFSKQDRRVLWGSYGEWDMSNPEIWKTYYEDQAKYEKLGKVRGKADPNGTFTANPFAVTAIKAGPLASKM